MGRTGDRENIWEAISLFQVRNTDKVRKRSRSIKRYLRDGDWLDMTNEGKGATPRFLMATRWMVVPFAEMIRFFVREAV